MFVIDILVGRAGAGERERERERKSFTSYLQSGRLGELHIAWRRSRCLSQYCPWWFFLRPTFAPLLSHFLRLKIFRMRCEHCCGRLVVVDEFGDELYCWLTLS